MTDRIDDDKERELIRSAAEVRLKNVIGKSMPFTDLAVCGQDHEDKIMRIIERVPMGRT